MTTSASSSEYDDLKTEIWNRALYASATAFIFEVRARRLKRRLQWLTFVALVVPIIIGGLVLAYGIGFPLHGAVIAAGAAVGLVQLVFSAWSVVAGWVDSYGYATTSVIENQRLFREFVALGQDRTADTDNLRSRYNILKATDDARQAQDYGQSISDEEKRMGHRAALRERQRVCVACGKTPVSMEPTDCAVCGKFKIRRL